MNKTIVYLSSLLFFCAAVLYITHPLLMHLTDFVIGYGDELIITWIQNWVIHSLLTNPLSLFDANTYYPYKNSLAYSDVLITTSLIALLPKVILNQPIVTFNVTLITSLIFLGFSTFCLSYYLSKSYLASLFSGLLVIFSPVVLDKKIHLQILSIYFVPFAILFFLKYLDSKRTCFLALFTMLFISQIYNSFMPSYFIIFACIIILFIYIKSKEIAFWEFFNIKTLFFLSLTFLIILPLLFAYYEVTVLYNAKRDIRDTIHFALQPEDLVYPNEHTRVAPLLLPIHTKLYDFFSYPPNSEIKTGFLGGVFSILVLLTITYAISRHKLLSLQARTLLYSAFIGFILSFGPLLHIGRRTIHEPFPIPLPYALLYYIAPGFQAFRNSARFEMMFVIFISPLIAFVLVKLLVKQKKKIANTVFILLILLVIFELPSPFNFMRIEKKEEFPSVYQWLTTTPLDTKIVELPSYNWYMIPYNQEELLRQYYSTLHFRNTINGASGYAPAAWEDRTRRLLHEFPSPATIGELRKLGINYIIIHPRQYDLMKKANVSYEGKTIRSGEEILSQISFSNIVFKDTVDDIYIYSLESN